MQILFNTATKQVVGYPVGLITAEPPLKLLWIPAIREEVHVYTFAPCEDKLILASPEMMTSAEDFVASDCLELDDEGLPRLITVYATSEKAARNKVENMLNNYKEQAE